MSENEFGLKRSLGLPSLIAVEIGTTIGAGIFVLIGMGIKLTGPSVPLAFIIAALPIILIMLSLAMVGSAIPCAGGTYRYASRLFNPGWSFFGIWGFALGTIAGAFPLYALKAAEYFLAAFPNYHPAPLTVKLAGAAILTVFYLANLRDLKLAGYVQALMVAILIGALIYFSASGLGQVKPENFTPLFPKGALGLFGAAAILTFSLLGSNSVIELGAEIKNPGRNIPLSLLIAIPCVTVLYVLIAVVAVGVLPWQQSAGKLLSEQAAFILGPVGCRFFIIGGAFLAITTTINGTFMWATKSVLVVADDRLLPPWLSVVHPQHHTPHRFLTIVWILSTASLFMNVPYGTFETFASIGSLIIFVPVMIAVLRFRKLLPHRYASAPFRLKGILYYLCPGAGLLLAIMAMVMCLSQLNYFWMGFFLAWLLVGASLYFLIRRWNRKSGHDYLNQNIQRDLAAWSGGKCDNP